MTPSLALALPRVLAPLAVVAGLLGTAPGAHAEADGATHAWLTPGTPLQKINTVWVRQEGTEDPVPVVITTTIKVGDKTIATLQPVTSPAVSIFDTVAVTIKVPVEALGAAKKEAVRANITDAQVTFRTTAINSEDGDGVAGPGREVVAMPIQPGVPVGNKRISGVTFTTGTWQLVGDSKWGRSKFAPVAAGANCSTVVLTSVDTIKRPSNVLTKLRTRLGNAKLVKSRRTPLPYVIGTLEGGVPRLVNGMADDAPPIVRAMAALPAGNGTKILDLEARPDAGCKASRASTNASIAALERVIKTARSS